MEPLTIFQNAQRMRREGAQPKELASYIQAATNGAAFDMVSLSQLVADQKEKPGFDVGNFAMGALQGASLGFADEIVGLVSGDENKEEWRRQIGEQREAHPWLSFGSELAGGVAGPGIGALKAVRGLAGPGASLATRVGLGGLIGAGEGLLAGVGEGEGRFPERLEGAFPATAIGGLLGGAMGAASPAVARLAKRGRSPEEAAAVLAQRTAGASPRGAAGVLSAAQEGAQARPGVFTGADVPEMSGLADAASTASPEARVMGQARAGAQRHRGMVDRIRNDIRELVGLDPDRIRAKAKAVAERRELATETYGAQLKAQAVPPDGILEFVGTPAFKRAWSEARTNAANEGYFLPELRQVIEEGREIPFEALHYVKKALDSSVETGFAGKSTGGKARASSTATVRDKLQRFMTENFEGYAEANLAYRTKSATIDGFTDGAKAIRSADPREIQDALATGAFKPGMPDAPPEVIQAYREAFQHAALDEFMTNFRPSQQVVSEALEGRLRALFPSEELFEQMLMRVQAERMMAEASRARRVGSPTADRQALIQEMNDVLGGAQQPQSWAGQLVAFITNPKLAAARMGVQRAAERSAERAASRTARAFNFLGERLFTDPSGLEELLNQPVKPPYRRGVLPLTQRTGQGVRRATSLFPYYED